MASRPRITFVSRKWPPAMGGMETYSKEICDALACRYQVKRIVLAGHRDGTVPGPFELIDFGVRAAASMLLERDPSPVVHVADMAIWPIAFFARLRRPSGRRLISAHGTDVAYPLRGGILGRAYGAYLSLGALLLGKVTVIANSAATASVAKRYGFDDIVVVPLAAEVEIADPVAGEPERTVLFSGRLVRLKGCRWFIENVLPRLPDDVTLEVAGVVWDEQEREALGSPRVRYLGLLEKKELWRRQAEALCVVVPNIELESGEFEGFGLVALEAAAAGGVVVAARHAGLIEAVRDGETGFLVAPGDADAWVKTIEDISSWSLDKRLAFTSGAQTICRTYYNWSRVVQETARVFDKTP